MACLLLLTANTWAQADVQARDGVLTLTAEQAQAGLQLNGEWLFGWHSEFEVDGNIQVPSTWQAQGWPVYGYANYQLTLELPYAMSNMALMLGDINSAWRLYVNNLLYAESGTTGASTEQEFPLNSQQIVFLPQQQVLHLRLVVSSYYTSSGGIGQAIEFGPSKKIQRQASTQQRILSMGAGGYLLAALFTILVFITDRRQSNYLFFSATCALLGLHFLLHDLSLVTLFPQAPKLFWAYAQHLCLLFFMPCYSLFINASFRQVFNQRVLYSLCGLTLAWSMLLLILPYEVIQLAFPYVYAAQIIWFALVLQALFKAKLQRQAGAGVMLGCAVILVLVTLHDVWYLLEQGQTHVWLTYGLFFWLAGHASQIGISVISYHDQQKNRSQDLTSDLKQQIAELDQSRLKAQQANEAKTDFLAMVSHEFRTPLNGILAATQSLQNTPTNAHQTDLVNLLERSGKHLNHLLNQIFNLILNKRNKIEISVFPINELLSDISALLKPNATAKGLQFYLSNDMAKNMAIRSDRHRLQQIMTNLLSNAIKFTQQGTVGMHVYRDDTQLYITVSDNGPGLSEQQIEQAFKPFTQLEETNVRSQGGLGLGLAITQQLVRDLNAELEIDSELGQGTNFHLTIPCIFYANHRQQKLQHQAALRQDLNVMVVDDEPLNHAVVRNLLADEAVVLQHCDRPEELLQRILKNLPDIILMDLQMPKVTGYQLIQQLRQHHSPGINQLDIWAVTANVSSEVKQQCLDAGFNGVLTKPIFRDQLVAVLNDSANPEAIANLQRHSSLDEVSDEERDNVRAIGLNSLNELLHKLQHTPHWSADEFKQFCHRIHGTALTLGWQQLAQPSSQLENQYQQLQEVQAADIELLERALQQAIEQGSL